MALNPKFVKFFDNLTDRQKSYLGHTLPKTLNYWYEGDLIGDQESEGLEIKARKYYTVEALAVALSHLKEVFPLRVPSTLYRLTHLKETPSGPTVKISSKNQLKPLLSFTSLKNPFVYDREFLDEDLIDVVLEWKADPRLVVMGTDWIVKTAKSISKELAGMRSEGMIDPKLYKSSPYRDDMSSNWKSVAKEAAYFSAEKEFVVFLPKNKSLACKWRPVTDEDGDDGSHF